MPVAIALVADKTTTRDGHEAHPACRSPERSSDRAQNACEYLQSASTFVPKPGFVLELSHTMTHGFSLLALSPNSFTPDANAEYEPPAFASTASMVMASALSAAVEPVFQDATLSLNGATSASAPWNLPTPTFSSVPPAVRKSEPLDDRLVYALKKVNFAFEPEPLDELWSASLSALPWPWLSSS